MNMYEYLMSDLEDNNDVIFNEMTGHDINDYDSDYDTVNDLIDDYGFRYREVKKEDNEEYYE